LIFAGYADEVGKVLRGGVGAGRWGSARVLGGADDAAANLTPGVAGEGDREEEEFVATEEAGCF
jgi:hypothetical protein